MRWLVNMFNHSKIGQRSLEDVVGIFGHQLRALGHEIVWDTNNSSFYRGDGFINLIVEGFTPGSIEIIRAKYDEGCRFVYLATEEPTPKGFNWGDQKEMADRQVRFAEAAKYCDAIFHLVPGKHVSDWYGQFAPTAYVELGYAPSLCRFQTKEPKFEFGFYGSLSRRRYALLKKLANRMYNFPDAVRIVSDFSTQEERDVEMGNCKIILQIRKFEKMGLVSSSRCNTALHLGRPIIAEPHDLSKPWDEVVKFTNTMEEFFATALAYRSSWKGLWFEQFTKFKEKFPPQYCVGRALTEVGFTGHSFEGRARQAA